MLLVDHRWSMYSYIYRHVVNFLRGLFLFFTWSILVKFRRKKQWLLCFVFLSRVV